MSENSRNLRFFFGTYRVKFRQEPSVCKIFGLDYSRVKYLTKFMSV